MHTISRIDAGKGVGKHQVEPFWNSSANRSARKRKNVVRRRKLEAYLKNCANGHKMVEIPKELKWSWYEKRKEGKRYYRPTASILNRARRAKVPPLILCHLHKKSDRLPLRLVLAL